VDLCRLLNPEPLTLNPEPMTPKPPNRTMPKAFEVEWTVEGGDAEMPLPDVLHEWTSVGFSGLEQRTVARLKGDTRCGQIPREYLGTRVTPGTFFI
jgi:hypothetical protein